MEDKNNSIEILNTEADLAADFLDELLNITDIEGDIEMGIKNDRAFVQIISEDKEDQNLNELVGEDNKVLLALQEVTRLAVSEQLGTRTNLLLDINNKRQEKQQKLLNEIEEKVKELGDEEVHLDHMNSFERKSVHDKVSELNAYSWSEGTGLKRHIVISKTPKEEKVEETQEEKTEE